MCRNIRRLYNVDPPTTGPEVRAAAEQYVRKVSGAAHPSKANQAVFDRAVESIAQVTEELLAALVTAVPPRSREQEAARAKERSQRRFGSSAVAEQA